MCPALSQTWLGRRPLSPLFQGRLAAYEKRKKCTRHQLHFPVLLAGPLKGQLGLYFYLLILCFETGCHFVVQAAQAGLKQQSPPLSP